ncbi:MAG: RIP metalloprotease [Chloroflexi bacterium]|nr:RIP metalloprotease [Chloroflexota bacterium]
MDLGRILITIALFLVVLGALVLVHELGHYLTAKAFRVRVLEFGIGFPPRAKVLGRRWDTLWTLNWLPIGGFVKLEGEDGDGADDPRSFSAQRLWVRLTILVAGVVMNVVLAFVIFVGIAWLATPVAGVTVPSVQPDSPALRAGIVAGDAILKVDGRGYDLYGGSILAGIRERAGETVTLTVRHADGSVEDLQVTLRSPAEAADRGALGISATEERPFESVFLDEYASRPLGDALQIGVMELGRWGSLIVGGLGELASGFVEDPTAPPPAAGPIGIATQIGDVFFGAGWIMTLYVVALLSVNLAVVNILPFPPLDGGRMLMITIKRVAGERISVRAEQLTYLVGFIFLFAFIIWITGFDIARQFGGAP